MDVRLSSDLQALFPEASADATADDLTKAAIECVIHIL